MQLFEDLVKCKDCMNNINSKCILYPGKDVKEKDTGCYVGIDKNNKQKIVGGVLSGRRNSIEEDMEILGAFNLAPSLQHISEDEFKDCQKAIEHILSDYKRVLEMNEVLLKENEQLRTEVNSLKKENEELKNKLLDTLEGQKVIKEETPQYIKENFIPKQTVKDKIEELKSVSNAEELEDIMNRKDYTITELVQYVLQELIEERGERIMSKIYKSWELMKAIADGEIKERKQILF